MSHGPGTGSPFNDLLSGKSVLLALAACALIAVVLLADRDPTQSSPSQAAEDAESSALPPERVEPAEAIGIPGAGARRALESSIAHVSSLEDAIRDMAPADQHAVLSFIGRFDSSAYAFSTAEEYAWMLARGFPSPQEIANAAHLDIDTLKARAASGDAKAAYFLVDRVMEEFPYDAGVAHDVAWLNAEAMTRLHQAMGTSSPFAGYVLSSMARRSKGVHPIFELVGLQVAYELGDARAQASAGEVGQRLMREVPDAGPHAALLAMQAQRTMVEVFDPMAFSPSRRTPIPGH